MRNKDKQGNNNSKQLNGISHLLDVFPRLFNVYQKVADRLNEKGLITPLGKPYNYNNVFQCARKGRWYDPNIHEELALLRKEYIEQQKRIEELANVEL